MVRIDRTETEGSHIKVGPFSMTKLRVVNFSKFAEKLRDNAAALEKSGLAALATRNRGNVALQAAEEQLPLFREVTGEDILAATERAGGKVEFIERDEDGLITEIRASIDAAYEYDASEMSEVLESLQASVTAKTFTGDLAQTSVLVNGVQNQVVGLMSWTIDWKRKVAEANTTDSAAYSNNKGSTKSWTVKSKFLFIDGDTSQAAYIYNVLTTLSSDSSTWNFFTTPEVGRAAFQGNAIIDGLSIATDMGKCIATDISMTGDGPLMMLAQTAPVANPNTVTGVTAQVPVS